MEASVQTEQRQQAGPGSEFADDRREGQFTAYRLTVNYEHRPGLGEDAPPISIAVSPENGLIGVFDGLGGAGGETIRTTDGLEHTSAWLASRLVRATVRDVYLGRFSGFDEVVELPELQPPRDFTVELKRSIGEKLVKWVTNIPKDRGGRLKSTLIKRLPTTMAVAWFDLGKNEFTAIWAGDSRVYTFRPDVGLQQVTTDDLKSNADALENLTQDSPMSNFVNADTDFVLHERRVALYPFTILIAASDGCFGYVQTPLHFEHMLLSTMQNATGWEDWQGQLQGQIERVTSDDSTLSAVALGWPDFASCKRYYAPRYEWCALRIRDYEDRHDRVKRLQRDLEEAKQDLAGSLRELWDDYRKTYENLAHVPTRDVPDRRGAEPQRAADLDGSRAEQRSAPEPEHAPAPESRHSDVPHDDRSGDDGGQQ